MKSNLTVASIGGILLDIEGTTTPISFVHEVLFTYARASLKEYVSAHWDSSDLGADFAKLRDEHKHDAEQQLNPPPLTQETDEDQIPSLVAYLNWLIDQDRKSPALKSIQGKIWREGYLDGTLKAELFDDVPAAMTRWRQAGLSINVFSSGSALAQELLFGHTIAGDFTGFIDNYFDTTVGSKGDVESYRRIAASLNLPPKSVVFISDVVSELDAARLAGMKTVLSVRPGNPPQSGGESHDQVQNFASLLI
jgi:enolase-phosphatase E1